MSDTLTTEKKRLKGAWRVFRKNRPAVVGAILLLVVIALSLLAPLLTKYNPLYIVGLPLVPPFAGNAHPLGTDPLGRDTLSELLYGTRTSLYIGISAALTSVAVGVVVGAAAGYYGKWKDELLMRITELFQIIPNFFLAIVAASLAGSTLESLILIIGLTSWPTTARLVRAEFLTLKERTFVEASRGLGASNLTIIFREIAPNAVPPIIVNGSFTVAQAILLEAGLSFFGVGDVNVPSLGRLLQAAEPYIQSAWWLSVIPGIILFVIILSFNLVGDGLNESLNPIYRER